MSTYTLNLGAIGGMDDEAFYRFCRDNADIHFERTARGNLVIREPTGGETGYLNANLIADLVVWNRKHKLGVCFDSSTGFRLPNGAHRSPDAAWIRQQRWDALTAGQKERFPPVAPDFVLELRSAGDTLKSLRAKMREYRDNGVQLGWLIDRRRHCAEIYRPGQKSVIMAAPQHIDGEKILPGFVLDLSALWD